MRFLSSSLDIVGLINIFLVSVEKATYYPFLKGAYFDSTLVALSQWPSSTYLPNLSIIQEPLETSSSFNNTFAQPIVFFDFEPLSNMVSSPFATNLTSLRLRIPSREITRFLCSPPRSMPNIGLLDLTTCRITETDIEALLGRFLTLRYLIVDKSLVVGGRDGDFRDGGMMMMNRWTALGKRMALAGVKSAKNREISVKTWLESQVRFITEETTTETTQEENTPDEVPPALPPPSKFKKKGRKGLSTATISIRERKRVLAYTSYATPGPSNDTSSPPPIQKVRILPPVPRLRAISLSVPTLLSNDPKLIESAQANFTRGWSEGLAQLVAIRSRIRTSWRKGTRVLIFNGVRSVRDEECKEDALDGLEDIEDEEGFLIKVEEEGECPIICFAGSSKRSGKGHVEDCAHSKGWEVWGDEL